AEAVGKPKVIPHDTACATRDYVANDLSAFVSFQPTVDVLWEEEPDLLAKWRKSGENYECWEEKENSWEEYMAPVMWFPANWRMMFISLF
ncbi:MAG: hypothetical protein AAGI07_12580, partial [Bacteroidota bacterium]